MSHTLDAARSLSLKSQAYGQIGDSVAKIAWTWYNIEFQLPPEESEDSWRGLFVPYVLHYETLSSRDAWVLPRGP